MEVERRRHSEMTEATSKVYDIVYPTPVSLKELSAMTISLEIWRREINEYRENRKLQEFNPYRIKIENTCIKGILPDIPSSVFKTIKEFFDRFEDSIRSWIHEHHKRVSCCYSHENYILQDFDDFVCDFDGSIHYARTAERMMSCVRFSMEMKFIVACTYFFEDDIRRIWPSVSRHPHLHVDFIKFYESPQLYYWICRLRKQLRLIPSWGDYTIAERMFRVFMPYNRPSVEYFWNRIPLVKQLKRAANLYKADFVRFILPKLNERQLYEFANCSTNGFDLVVRGLHSDECDWLAALRTWSYIKNIINENKFNELVVNLIEMMTHHIDEEVDHEKWEALCGQVWNDTPANLKQSAIRLISTESGWLRGMNMTDEYESNQIHFEFLFRILQDASFDERRSFWRNCWEILIEAVLVEDVQRMMELCFEKEEEITEFKRNVIVNSRATLTFCASLLESALFNELNTFVSFCCSELPAARNFKRQILRSAFLDEDCQLSYEIIDDSEGFSVFVNDADVSADFKNLIVSSPAFMQCLANIICECEGDISLETLVEFIAIFVSTEEGVIQVKMSLIDSLKTYVTLHATNIRGLFRTPEFNSILLWCLGSNEAVVEFKFSCRRV